MEEIETSHVSPVKGKWDGRERSDDTQESLYDMVAIELSFVWKMPRVQIRNQAEEQRKSDWRKTEKSNIAPLWVPWKETVEEDGVEKFNVDDLERPSQRKALASILSVMWNHWSFWARDKMIPPPIPVQPGIA